MFKKSSIALVGLLFSNITLASEALNADQIKSLFSNKTFDIHNVVKDKKLKAFDSANGKHLVYIPWKDKKSKRKWWVEGDKHCTSHPKRSDSCKTIVSKADGVYHGITDGKHTHTLSNFRDGNQL